MYELGTRYQYYIVGRAQGRWMTGQIVAPLITGQQFLRLYAAPGATAPPLSLQPIQNASQKTAKNFSMHGVYVSSVSQHHATAKFSLQESVMGTFIQLLAET